MSYRILARSNFAHIAVLRSLAAKTALALVGSLCMGACGGSVASTATETESGGATPTASTPAAATLFAHFEDKPSAIALGTSYVYVATKTARINGVLTDNGAVWAVSKTTAERYQVFLDRFGASPVSLARSGSELVIAMSDGRVLAMPENGGDARLAARVQGTPIQLVATLSDAVLRISEEPSLLVSVGLGNGSVRTRFTPDATLVSLSADGDTVYVGMKTSDGHGRVLRMASPAEHVSDNASERTMELPAAPCAMSASRAAVVLTDGSTTLRYWDGSTALTPFTSDLPSTCTVATSGDRVFWAGTAPKVRTSTGTRTGGTVLLSRMLAPSGAADWISTDLDAISQAESDASDVYVLTTEDVVRVARPISQ